MDKYENEHGQIGVIVSGRYGAGWSTWNEYSEFLCMDKTLVEMRLNNAPESDLEAYCKKVKGYSPHMGGWKNARVEWLDKGTEFIIEEHDGSETLILAANLVMTA